jgi:hypothetical protein
MPGRHGFHSRRFPAPGPTRPGRSWPSRGNARSSCRWRCCRRWALRKRSCRGFGAQLVHHAVVGGHDELLGVHSRAAFRMALVEPTASASATTSAGLSGCTSTLASGCSFFSASSSKALNSSCTMQSRSRTPCRPRFRAGCSRPGGGRAPTGSCGPCLSAPARCPARSWLVTSQSARAFTAALVLA